MKRPSDTLPNAANDDEATRLPVRSRDPSSCTTHRSHVEPPIEDVVANYRLLDSVDVAQILRMTPTRLCIWRSEGKGPPFIRVGRLVRYRLRTVLNWISDNEEGLQPTYPIRLRSR
jgi:hypothetical protein